ncbi:cytochrome c3 family protein [Acidobacteriota bacterium]
MKKLLIVFAALALTAGAFGQTIVGSLHDFSGSGWSGGEICIACHTPHNADTSVIDAPLWNHDLTSQTFTLYTSPTLDATLTSPALGGVSKLCLSCHDGTVALDAYGDNTGTTFMAAGATLIGTDLSGTHPISFVYDAALATADGELFDPVTTASGIVGSSGDIDDDMLFATKMECASCHDVHNRGIPKLLVKSNAASGLCLTCHDK